MNTKLTLSINQNIVEKAKQKLKTSGVSISKIVEDYLRLLIAEDKTQVKKTSIVQELSNTINYDKKIDVDEVVVGYLIDKYK